MAKGELFSWLKKGRKGEGDNDVFMYAFLVVLIIAAGTYGAGSGAFGALFTGLNSAMSALGLNTPASCPFYRQAGSVLPWACMIVFGIIPFIIVYYFTFDALSFTFMTTRTKGMLALGVSMIATIPMNGNSLLSNLTAILVQFTGWLIPSGGGSTYAAWGGFLGIMLVMALISGFLGQLALTSQMANAAVLSLQETIWGYRAMNQIGRTMTQTGKNE